MRWARAGHSTAHHGMQIIIFAQRPLRWLYCMLVGYEGVTNPFIAPAAHDHAPLLRTKTLSSS